MAKRDGGQHEKEAQNWGGAGQQEEAKPTRTRRGRSQTRNWEKRSERQGNKESEQNKIKISAGLVSGGTCILELARKSEVSDSTNSMIWSL
ncbi:hypothetical protein TNCV_3772891 [Trichonephila clavipes]|nr:hypothetical protein TNCV_3772891 [Trichonephila clavipes]